MTPAWNVPESSELAWKWHLLGRGRDFGVCGNPQKPIENSGVIENVLRPFLIR